LNLSARIWDWKDVKSEMESLDDSIEL
jgi:hypothetical protein